MRQLFKYNIDRRGPKKVYDRTEQVLKSDGTNLTGAFSVKFFKENEIDKVKPTDVLILTYTTVTKISPNLVYMRELRDWLDEIIVIVNTFDGYGCYETPKETLPFGQLIANSKEELFRKICETLERTYHVRIWGG